jgi:hypothetical protein
MLIKGIQPFRVVQAGNKSNLLGTVPVDAGGAEQCPCSGVMVAPVRLDVSRQGWIERGISRCYPVKDGAFQTLGIV